VEDDSDLGTVSSSQGGRGSDLPTCGDIEKNPGPWGDDYQVIPSLIPGILPGLSCPTPTSDAFCSSHNALFPAPWGFGADALAQHWDSNRLLWMNPPFQLLDKVLEKLTTEGGFVLLICPGWRRHLPQFWRLSSRQYRLPPGPTFRKGGITTLPMPPWPTWALLIQLKNQPPRPVSLPGQVHPSHRPLDLHALLRGEPRHLWFDCYPSSPSQRTPYLSASPCAQGSLALRLPSSTTPTLRVRTPLTPNSHKSSSTPGCPSLPTVP
jgi:hypothetical protein